MDVKPAAVLLVALLLAGCGGHNDPQFKSARDVAKAFGCVAFKPAQSELYAADTGECRLGHAYEDVNWFSSNSDLNSWWSAGGGSGSVLRGDNWTVSCQGRADCRAIQKKIGGALH